MGRRCTTAPRRSPARRPRGSAPVRWPARARCRRAPATPIATHAAASTARRGRGAGLREPRWSDPLVRVDALHPVERVVGEVHADLQPRGDHERRREPPPHDVPGGRRADQHRDQPGAQRAGTRPSPPDGRRLVMAASGTARSRGRASAGRRRVLLAPPRTCSRGAWRRRRAAAHRPARRRPRCSRPSAAAARAATSRPARAPTRPWCASSSSSGTTVFTSPQSSAVAASYWRHSSHTSFARFSPIWRASSPMP